MPTLSTRQKREVHAVVDGMDAPFTIDDVRAKLAESHSRVSRASAYRIVQSLCLSGRIRLATLPDGRRVFARALEGAALAIIECASCGRLSSCHALAFDQCLDNEAARRGLRPIETAIYMRGECRSDHCPHAPARGRENPA